MGNDKYVERSMQTSNGTTKKIRIQTDKIEMVDEGKTELSLKNQLKKSAT